MITYRSRSYTPEAFEHAFNPRIAAFDTDRSVEQRARMSAETRARLASTSGIRYGERPREFFDYFPAGRGAPLLLYIHGGYWRGGQALDNHFVADAFVAAGIAVAVLNYDLCPQVKLGDIVAQVQRALPIVTAKLAAEGADPSRLVLAGHSAGAHLAAMMLTPAWRSPVAVQGAVLVSGIYDVEPALSTTVNADIRATTDDVPRYSPLRLPIALAVPLVVTAGAAEPEGWREQSVSYAAHARAHGCRVHYAETSGDDHYGAIFRIRDAGDALTRAALALF